MPVIVSGAAVFVSEILPAPVLVALKLETVFALPSVVPPTEEVMREAADHAPLCPMVLPDVNDKILETERLGNEMAAVV